MPFLQSYATESVMMFLPRRSTACHGHSRSRPTLLLTLCLHYSQVCRVKNENTGIGGMDLQGVNLSFVPTMSNHPKAIFLRDIPSLKVSYPWDDARHLVACNPCECQAGGMVWSERVMAGIFMVQQVGEIMSTVSWSLPGKCNHTLCRS